MDDKPRDFLGVPINVGDVVITVSPKNKFGNLRLEKVISIKEVQGKTLVVTEHRTSEPWNIINIGEINERIPDFRDAVIWYDETGTPRLK